jgi:cell division protein FtsQ
VLAPLRQRIDRLVLSDRGSWRVNLDRGTVIELGRGESDQVVARTQRFVGSVVQITARFEHRAIEYADLRHSESYALRLVGMGTTPVALPAGKTH